MEEGQLLHRLMKIKDKKTAKCSVQMLDSNTGGTYTLDYQSVWKVAFSDASSQENLDTRWSFCSSWASLVYSCQITSRKL